MRQSPRWEDINTNFGGVSAMAAVAANSRRHNMDMMNKFRDDHNASRLAEEALAREQGTGNMLVDQAAGREVDFSQPHNSLAYYQDAQKLADSNRDYQLEKSKSDSMTAYYNNRTNNENMTMKEQKEMERDNKELSLMASMFKNGKKSGGSGGSKGKGGGNRRRQGGGR